jgi:hypothetical protein
LREPNRDSTDNEQEKGGGPQNRPTCPARRAPRRRWQRGFGRRTGHIRACRLERLDTPDEPVASPRKCFDELGRLGGIAERLTRFFDCRVQAVFEIDESVGLPQPLAQIVTRNDFARPFEQGDDDLSRVFLQVDSFAIAVQLACGRIQFEMSSEANARWSRR